jgi:uncharacterized protein (DUF1778 family)
MANARNERRRLTVRLPADVRRTIERAAVLSGASLNQFLVQSALEKAHRLIGEAQPLTLSAKDSAAFFEALDNPPAPNRTLRNAVARFRDTLPDAHD